MNVHPREGIMKLEICSLVKNYGKKQALKGINAVLSEGVYGFLGPNGAGRSVITERRSGSWGGSSGQFWAICHSSRPFIRISRRWAFCPMWRRFGI